MIKPTLPPLSLKAGPVAFIKQVKTELKKVTWPTRQETIRLTAIVVVFSIIVAIYIGALDFIFTKATELVIKR